MSSCTASSTPFSEQAPPAVASKHVFTGIIEEIGTVAAVEGDSESGYRLAIECRSVLEDLEVGSSVAVDGICLTATEVGQSSFSVQTVPETLSRTTLRGVESGYRVNLERAMAADGRFDGHIVQGHVDGVGVVIAIAEEGEGCRMTIDSPESVVPHVVVKGSVTVDGISLTVAAVDHSEFEVALIPHTLGVTTISDRRAGDPVNLEADILAKYVSRLLAR